MIKERSIAEANDRLRPYGVEVGSNLAVSLLVLFNWSEGNEVLDQILSSLSQAEIQDAFYEVVVLGCSGEKIMLGNSELEPFQNSGPDYKVSLADFQQAVGIGTASVV